MRFLLISAAAILGIAWGGFVPATAAPMSLPIVDGGNGVVTAVEKVGYWRRHHRRAYRGGGTKLLTLTIPRRIATTRRRLPTATTPTIAKASQYAAERRWIATEEK
jgi:hypothetical protein